MSHGLGKSNAIGFWSKHAWLLDQLYHLDSEQDDWLPSNEELRSQLGESDFVTEVTERRVKISEIFETATSDVSRLDSWLKNQVSNHFTRPYKQTGSGRINWGSHVDVGYRDARRGFHGMRFGWEWVTSVEGRLQICCYVWSRGGRPAREKALRFLQNGCVDLPEECLPSGWDKNSILIGSVPVEFDEEFCSDLDHIASLSRDVFAKFNAELLEGLFLAYAS